jgi:hypothetical protein
MSGEAQMGLHVVRRDESQNPTLKRREWAPGWMLEPLKHNWRKTSEEPASEGRRYKSWSAAVKRLCEN